MAVRGRKHDLGRTQMFAVKNILQAIFGRQKHLENTTWADTDVHFAETLILELFFVETKQQHFFPVSTVLKTCC